jgi:hypothetical protein
MDATFGTANDFAQPSDTLFANLTNLSDNGSAGRAYVLFF